MHLHFLTLAFPGSLGWREESEHLHQQHSLLSSLGLHFLKPSKRALAGGAEQGLPQGWVQISACRDAGGAARHSWAPQSGAASNAAQPLPFLMNHTSSHFSHISLGDRSERFVFWMNFVRASRRDFFGKGFSYSLTDSKKHEIVGVFFFFEQLHEGRKCEIFWEQLSFIQESRSAVPLPFSHHLCVLTLTILETKHLLHLSSKPG